VRACTCTTLQKSCKYESAQRRQTRVPRLQRASCPRALDIRLLRTWHDSFAGAAQVWGKLLAFDDGSGTGQKRGGEETPLLAPGTRGGLEGGRDAWGGRVGGYGGARFSRGPGVQGAFGGMPGMMGYSSVGGAPPGQFWEGARPMGRAGSSYAPSYQQSQSGRHGGSAGYYGAGGPQGASNEATLALQSLLGQSKAVQAAGTILGLVNSVDSSRFWSKFVRRVAMAAVACVAVFSMFKCDVSGARHPVSAQVPPHSPRPSPHARSLVTPTASCLALDVCALHAACSGVLKQSSTAEHAQKTNILPKEKNAFCS
jgi:hypothetical protein